MSSTHEFDGRQECLPHHKERQECLFTLETGKNACPTLAF